MFGILERGGNVSATVVENTRAATVLPIVARSVAPGTAIMTDDYSAYSRLGEGGHYAHQAVAHGRREWARGEVHTNGIEGFWSQMKRSIDGTHHHVSGKHLQKYADEYSFRYNRRKSERPMFHHLTSQLSVRKNRLLVGEMLTTLSDIVPLPMIQRCWQYLAVGALVKDFTSVQTNPNCRKHTNCF